MPAEARRCSGNLRFIAYLLGMQNQTISFREHRELGDVAWLRDFDQALEQAAKQDKPVLMLFQEVPGCQTCVRYGHDILSHPLMVELIQTRFVPLAIYNNHPGPDAEVLRRFGEPSWNNPVSYVLRADGTPLIARHANRYDPVSFHDHLTSALRAAGQPVPRYFELLRGDLLIEAGLAPCVTYETPCFWSGETSLAQAPGVIATLAGWVGGEEVVRVWFDPQATSRGDLDRFARQEGFTVNTASGFKVDKEPQFYLRKQPARFLPLGPAQRSAINLAIPYRQSLDELLSETQLAWLGDPRLKGVAGDENYRRDIRESWPELARHLAVRSAAGTEAAA